jgi:two-component system sensor histidine kinase NreB
MASFTNMGSARETSSFLESIFKHMTDAIIVIDKQGFVVGVNPAAETLIGWSAEELSGKVHVCAVCKGIATCSEEATCAECFREKLNVPSFEMRVITKSGHEFPAAASSARLPEESGADFVVILRDMSEQHRIERERFHRVMTNYVIQAQEEERKRVSRDLHDGVGQALYSIIVGMKVLDQLPMDEVMRHHLAELQQMTVRALEEVRSLAVDLRPSALDDLGLVPAIRSFIKRFEQTFGIESYLEVEGKQRRYSSAVETALYRICQEAMTNAAKYADTDQVFVRISDYNNRIEMKIEDHGCGFDTEQILIQGTGLGLYGMKERANLLGGDVKIHSTIGRGTTIHVVIPLDEEGAPLYVDPGTYCR